MPARRPFPGNRGRKSGKTREKRRKSPIFSGVFPAVPRGKSKKV
jgi:hypothetical protein